jgi:hypothetical protein
MQIIRENPPHPYNQPGIYIDKGLSGFPCALQFFLQRSRFNSGYFLQISLRFLVLLNVLLEFFLFRVIGFLL